MISFIIIGKNIENTIGLCLDSVFRFIEANKIKQSEVIYVDSQSTDKTIEIACKFPIHIYQITGEVNAAIGRNVGAEKSKGDILFFIDGDMELLPDFFFEVFNEKYELVYDFIRGHHIHLYYDDNFSFKFERRENLPSNPQFSFKTGGLFLINKSYWKLLGGMDERLIRNQDVDFGLRMSQIKKPVLTMNKYFVKHHTMDYVATKRFFYFINSSALFSPGILLRKHFFNRYYWKLYFRNGIYFLLLNLSFISIFINRKASLFFFALFFSIQFLRSMRNRSFTGAFLRQLVYKLLFNIYSFGGFYFIFSRKRNYRIKEITRTINLH